MKKLWYALVLLFVLFAVVQYNDPDPLVWIGVYLSAAYLCYFRASGKGNKTQFFLMGLLYAFWAINQFPPQWEGLMIENLSMKTMNVELGRESLGLGMCALAAWSCMIKK